MKHAATTRSRVIRAALLVLFAVLVLVGWVAASTVMREGSALPGTRVAGASVSGMTADQITQSVEKRFAAATFEARVGDEKLSVPLSQTGVGLDVANTVKRAMSGSGQFLPTGAALFSLSDRSLAAQATVDEGAFSTFADTVDALTGNPPVAPGIEIAEDGATHRATEGRPGRAVDRDALRAAILDSAQRLSSDAIDLKPQDAQPLIDDDEAAEAASRADALVAGEFTLAGPKETYTAQPQDKAKWVRGAVVDGRLTAEVDEEQVGAWVDSVLAQANRQPINAINAVDASGNVLQLARPAKPGIDVTNGDAMKKSIAEAVSKGASFAGTLTWTETPAQTESRVVPSGPERFPYRAKPGEKWIDINLTDSTLTAYQGTEVVHGPILINHGGVGHETVTGTYHVYLKYKAQDMGCTPDWPYCERQVPWVAYWYKDYAMHGAPWVKEFGIGTDESSHGCINIPVDEAHWVHDFVEIGTTVVTHY